MSIFDDREKAAEIEMVKNAETRFRIEARRNKLLGQWAAEKMGLEGEAAKNYTVEVIKSDMEEPGDDDVFRKIRADFDAAKIIVTDAEIKDMMKTLMAEAQKQILPDD